MIAFILLIIKGSLHWKSVILNPIIFNVTLFRNTPLFHQFASRKSYENF